MEGNKVKMTTSKGIQITTQEPILLRFSKKYPKRRRLNIPATLITEFNNPIKKPDISSLNLCEEASTRIIPSQNLNIKDTGTLKSCNYDQKMNCNMVGECSNELRKEKSVSTNVIPVSTSATEVAKAKKNLLDSGMMLAITLPPSDTRAKVETFSVPKITASNPIINISKEIKLYSKFIFPIVPKNSKMDPIGYKITYKTKKKSKNQEKKSNNSSLKFIPIIHYRNKDSTMKKKFGEKLVKDYIIKKNGESATYDISKIIQKSGPEATIIATVVPQKNDTVENFFEEILEKETEIESSINSLFENIQNSDVTCQNEDINTFIRKYEF